MSWERRQIGPWSAAALVMGNMIGAGVFTTSGFALADLGDPRWVLLAWALGGGVALCGALSYGGLARRIPRSGGEYTFLAEALHPAWGCTAGWISLLAGFTAPIAAAALVFDRYLGSILGRALPEGFGGAAAVLAAGLAHGVRVGGGAWLQNAVVALKLVLLVALIGWGGFAIAERGVPPHATTALDLGAFGVTLVWVSFAYSGWNGAVYLAGELRDPDRNLSRCLWLPAAVVAVLYLALNTVFLYAAPVEQLAGRAEIGAVAAEALGGERLQRGVVLIVCLALLTSISAMVMAGPRVYAQMALDGYLPRFFARGQDTPAAAIGLQVGCAVAVMGFAGLIELLGYLGFTLSLSAALTVAAAMRLRHREGAARVPIPLYPWIPSIFIAFTLGAAGFLVWRAPMQAAFGLATAALGVPLYWWRRRQGERLPGR